jgi:hypothetical protein
VAEYAVVDFDFLHDYVLFDLSVHFLAELNGEDVFAFGMSVFVVWAFAYPFLVNH